MFDTLFGTFIEQVVHQVGFAEFTCFVSEPVDWNNAQEG